MRFVVTKGQAQRASLYVFRTLLVELDSELDVATARRILLPDEERLLPVADVGTTTPP